jgi:hypothetical protein
VTPGGYYGNFWGYHAVTEASDQAMQQPLCWITNAFDRSPSELLWVDSPAWGPLHGALLNFSYGYGKVYVVPHEKVGGVMQGGLCVLPIPLFPTGVMRGRLHPRTGELYCCGMFAWAGNQTQPGGFYRVRYTGKPICVPIGLQARRSSMAITFTSPLDPKAAADPNSYAVKTWSLKRSEKYGSDHFNEQAAQVTAARLSHDGKTVSLEIMGMKPTWCMEIKYTIRTADGTAITDVIHNTVHQLSE